MRKLVTCLLLLAGLVCAQAAASGAPAAGSATVTRKRVVIVRRGKLARDFPGRRRAVVNLPVVSGLTDREVLRKVRALLDLKNVFETSLEEYRQDAWLSELDYKVNYNRNYILDITFRQEGVGAYPDTDEKHLAVNLRTGEVIKAADAFERGAFPRLVEMANARLRAEAEAQLAAAIKEDDAGRGEDDPLRQLLRELTFGPENLDEFEVSDRGVTFLYDAGFPHVIQAYQPEGRYFFSYAQFRRYIRRDGPLGRFVK